jgi:hypothetical protein
MKSLRDEKCRAEIIRRIDKLTPDAKASWGRMSVEQMLSHLVQGNELPFVASVPDGSNFMSRNVVKPLMLYLLPIPKEIKTSAEMDQQQKGRPPAGFETDKTELIEGVNKIGTLPLDHDCLPHPFFGKLSVKEWGAIAHKHIDHHLRQFGV